MAIGMKPDRSAPLELSLEPFDAAEPAPPTGSGATEAPVGADDARSAADTFSPAIASAPAPLASSAAPGSHAGYLAQATLEYEQGQIDSLLWTRALARAANDQTLARTFYLVSRAIALRVLKRRTSGKRGRRDSIDERSAAFDEPASGRRKQLRWAIAAAAGIAIVAGAVWVVVEPGAAPGGPSLAVATVMTASVGSAPKTARGSATAPVPKANTVTSKGVDNEETRLGARVRELRDAGNWNVLVLTANEWTRKAPGNPSAWLELSAGYFKLRQYDDALDAARRAQQLVPDDVALWRQLAQIQQQRGDPAGALHAFQQVTLRDPQDADSLVQIGLLQAQLDRLPEARLAIDQALAISPSDPLALCGAASIAQREGHRKEADALTRQIAGLGLQCATTSRHPGAANPASQPTEAVAVRQPKR